MRRCGLREFAVWFRFHRMNQVRKFDRVLNEKHWHIIAHKVPVALIGIKLDRKAAHISRQVGRPLVACHGRKPDENIGLFARGGKWRSLRDLSQGAGADKRAMRPIAARMDNPFRDTFVIKMKDLFAQGEILKQGWARCADAQRILVVGDDDTLRGGQPFSPVFGVLMHFATRTARGNQVCEVV